MTSFLKKKRGKVYCGECLTCLSDASSEAGQCKCGRFAWWHDDGGHSVVEMAKKSERVQGRVLQKMGRSLA